MTRARRFFTDEFKAEAVALLESSGRPLEQVARELGIQPSMLRNWRRRREPPGEPAPLPMKQAAAPRAAVDLQAENARLRRENERLRMEREILKNTLHRLSPTEVRFRLVEDCKAEYPVGVLCDALDVSASGYYAWTKRPASPGGQDHDEILSELRRLHGEHRGRYRSPRIPAALRSQRYRISRGRVACLTPA